MTRERLIGAALIVIMGWLAGCDAAWRDYVAIQLDQPLPPDSVLQGGEVEEDGEARKWEDLAAPAFPLTAGGYSLKVLIDPDGRVIAKSYSATAYAHWIVVQSIALRTVIEVVLPEPSAEQEVVLVSPPNRADDRAVLASVRVTLHPSAISRRRLWGRSSRRGA